jgi:hypothetical protein
MHGLKKDAMHEVLNANSQSGRVLGRTCVTIVAEHSKRFAGWR